MKDLIEFVNKRYAKYILGFAKYNKQVKFLLDQFKAAENDFDKLKYLKEIKKCIKSIDSYDSIYSNKR